MSLVNDMLRDLERRRARDGDGDTDGTGLQARTVAHPSPAGRWGVIAAVVLLVGGAAAGGGWWWLEHHDGEAAVAGGAGGEPPDSAGLPDSVAEPRGKFAYRPLPGADPVTSVYRPGLPAVEGTPAQEAAAEQGPDGEPAPQLKAVRVEPDEDGRRLGLVLKFSGEATPRVTVDDARRRMEVQAPPMAAGTGLDGLREVEWLTGVTLTEGDEGGTELGMRFREPVRYRAWRESPERFRVEIEYPEPQSDEAAASAPTQDPTGEATASEALELDAVDDMISALEADEALEDAGEGEVDPQVGEDQGEFRRQPSSGDPERRARRALEQGEAMAAAGDLGGASEAFREALELDPSLTAARERYAQILAGARRPERARDVLAEGLERDPDNQRLARMYATLAAEAGDPERAVARLEEARREDDPGTVEAQLASLYRNMGRHDRAALLYAELAEAEPGNGLWQVGLALAAEGLGQEQAAREAWQRALELGGIPDDVAAHARVRLGRVNDD